MEQSAAFRFLHVDESSWSRAALARARAVALELEAQALRRRLALADLPSMQALSLLMECLAGEAVEAVLARAATGAHADPRRVDRAFASQPHVLVAGPSRSGTRWLLEAAGRLCALGGPTLVLSDTSPLPSAGASPSTSAWEHRAALHNRYFPPSKASQAESCLRALSPIQALQFVVPRGVRLVTKEAERIPLTSWRALGNPRIVRVVRDPRNVALSRRHFFRGGRPDALALTFDVVRVLYALDRTRRREARLRHLDVRYEDMLRDLPGMLGRMAGFLGPPPGRGDIDQLARELTFEAMSGRKPGDMRSGDYFRGGSDWSRELTPAERSLVRRLDPWIRRMGYGSTRRANGRARQAARAAARP